MKVSPGRNLALSGIGYRCCCLRDTSHDKSGLGVSALISRRRISSADRLRYFLQGVHLANKPAQWADAKPDKIREPNVSQLQVR
jgi:hypothetical protein